MVLGIRERTGRSVTPKTDRTAVDSSSSFSRFLINFCTVVVVKQTHVVDPKRLTHIHSHRDLNSLSLSTESTYLLGTHAVNLLEGRAARTLSSTRRRLELQRYHFSEVETGGAQL